MTEREQALHELAAVSGATLKYLKAVHRGVSTETIREHVEAVRRVNTALIEEILELDTKYVRSALEDESQATLGGIRDNLRFERELVEYGEPTCRDVEIIGYFR